MKDHIGNIGSGFGVMFLVESVRKGNVVRIPSIGAIITSKHLSLADQEGAKSPTVAAIVEALHDCLTAQERKLSQTTDPKEMVAIQEVIDSLQADLLEPEKYLLTPTQTS